MTKAQKMILEDQMPVEKAFDNPIEKKRRESMLRNLNTIVSKVKFKEVMQNLESGAQCGLQQTNAYVFQKECLNSMDVMLPIMEKIKNNHLILQDYAVSSGQVSGVAKAIVLIGKPVIKHILLDNCLMTDAMAAELLNAFLQRQTLVELAFKRNVFLETSLKALVPIMQIKPPQNLLELRLVNCQTTPKVMNELLGALADCMNINQLRCLALVQMRINFPLDSLAKIAEAGSLQELDFSGNHCLPRHFIPFWKTLASNKTLQTLNLSWNMMLD